MFMFNTTPKDWPEDFAHENGQYLNKCYDCGFIFTGYKRRVECKECYVARSAKDVKTCCHKTVLEGHRCEGCPYA